MLETRLSQNALEYFCTAFRRKSVKAERGQKTLLQIRNFQLFKFLNKNRLITLSKIRLHTQRFFFTSGYFPTQQN